MKKILTIIILVISTISSWAKIPLDTIPFWNIYYGNIILIQGNISQQQTEKQEVNIKKRKVAELVVTFNYDVGQLDKAELTIKQGGKILKIIEYNRGDERYSLPRPTGGGSYFDVPLRDMIDLKLKKGYWELEFYYSDQRGQNNLKLGTIIFII